MAAVLGDLDDDGDEFGEAHDINVTPFIDVMLVLLIIFMIAAPLSTVDLPVDLPTSTAVPQKKPDKPTYVTIKADLAVAIGETPVKRVDLVRTLDAMAGEGKDRRIFLRADRGVSYGELMDVLERLRAGGYGHIALVALEGVPDAPRRARPPALLLREIVRCRSFITLDTCPRRCGVSPGSLPSHCMPAVLGWRLSRSSRTTSRTSARRPSRSASSSRRRNSSRPICRSVPTPRRRRRRRRWSSRKR